MEKAKALNITLFYFKPHTTHICQPLDVGVFGPMKQAHRDHIDKATRTGCANYNKIEFLHDWHSIRKQGLKSSTIRHSFRDAGVYPRDPEAALGKWKDLARPKTPDWDAGESELPPTLQTVRSLTRLSLKVGEIVDDSRVSSLTVKLMQMKVSKAAIAQAHKAAMLEQQVNEIE